MDSSDPLTQLRLACVRPWTPPHADLDPLDLGHDPGTDPDPDPNHDQLQPTPALHSLHPTPHPLGNFGFGFGLASPSLMQPPLPPNSQFSHLAHAGVLHELILLRNSSPPQLLWRKAGQAPIDLSPTPPLTTLSACLCYLPRWTPHPVAIQLLSDRLIKCTDLGTGSVRWTSVQLPGRATHVVRLGDNGVAFTCAPASAAPAGAADPSPSTDHVIVLVDHPSADQSMLAVQDNPGHPVSVYKTSSAQRVIADGTLWTTTGNGKMRIFTIMRVPALQVYPGMHVDEVEDEPTLMEAVDESFVADVSSASVIVPPSAVAVTPVVGASAGGSRRSRPSASASASASSAVAVAAGTAGKQTSSIPPNESSRKSSRASTRRTTLTTAPPTPRAPHSPPPQPSLSTPAAAADDDDDTHQHEKARANATVLHTQPARPPRLSLAAAAADLTVARAVLVPLDASQVHVPVVCVIACEDAAGRACVAVHFADGAATVHESYEEAGGAGRMRLRRVALFERVSKMVGVSVWGRRGVAVVAGEGGEVYVWAGHARALSVDVGGARSLVMGLGDGLVFRDEEDAGGYVRGALASTRWDKSPEMRQVLDVLGAVLPLNTYLDIRDTHKVTDPLSGVILDSATTTSTYGVGRRQALLCAASAALFLLIQEWSLNDLMRRSAQYLAEALVPVLVEVGWVQHLEYLAHRYFADRVDAVLGGFEDRLTADVQEPRPMCLVAFAAAREVQAWPTITDLRTRFGVDDEPPATSITDLDVFPMTSALAHLLDRLHSSPSTDSLLDHLSPTLAYLHALWQSLRARFSALPLGWRLLVTATVELARLEPEYVGALPFSATAFLDRADLAFGAQPPPPPAPDSSSTSTNSAHQDDDDPSAHTLHDPLDLSMARQLLTIPSTLHVAYAYKYVKLGRAEHLEIQEQEAVIDRTVARVLAVYPGAAALDFKSVPHAGGSLPPAAVNLLPLPITVDMQFKVRATGNVACDPLRLVVPATDPNDREYNWVVFHAGVAKALSMQLPSTLTAGAPSDAAAAAAAADNELADPFVAWLWTSRPPTSSRPWPVSLGGWYLGLGLLGYLASVPGELLLHLLGHPPAHAATTPVHMQPQVDVGVLIGAAASRLGSADKRLHGMLIAFAPKVFDATAPAAAHVCAGHVPTDQTVLAGVLGMGLLLAGTGTGTGTRGDVVTRCLFENALCEAHVVRMRAARGVNGIGDGVAGEGLRVVAAVALAFVHVGRAERKWMGMLEPLWDERRSGRMVAVTAAPAWIVYGWVFWNCKSEEVRRKCRVGRVGSAEVRVMEGKALFYRAAASFLVEWDEVDVAFVRQVWAKVRREVKEMVGTSVHLLVRMAGDTVMTAAVYVLAIKLAGTADREAAKLCWELVDEMVSRLHYDPDIVRHLDPDGAPGNPTPLDLQSSHQANHWLYTAHLSAALILAGTGDRHAYRRLVRLQQRTGPNITYGLHSQANLALGLLFCGRGKHAVRTTSPISALALFASTLPCFTPASQADDTTTLHAMTHLWVLAAKATVVNAVSLASGEHVNVCATLSTEASSSNGMGSVATSITLPYKFELPLPVSSTTWTLSIDDPAWYPLTLLVDDLVAGNSAGAGGRSINLLPKDGLELASHKHASRVVKPMIPGKVQHLLGQLMHAVVSESGVDLVRALDAVRLVNARAIKLKLFAAVDRAYAGGGEGVSRIAVEVERARQLVMSKYPLPVFAGPAVGQVEAVAGQRGTVLHGMLAVARSEAAGRTAASVWEVASRAVFYGGLMSTKLVQDQAETARVAREMGVEEDVCGFLRMLMCDDDSTLML